jgi:hypothetical protein
MNASFERSAPAGLGLLRATIALSPIVLRRDSVLQDPFVRPIANWAQIRQSAEVDAFILAWLASQGRGVARGQAA